MNTVKNEVFNGLLVGSELIFGGGKIVPGVARMSKFLEKNPVDMYIYI